MSQGEKEKDTKEKKKVPGWSIEEMKERPNIAAEEDTEEMKRWRSLNRSEMDLCWKSLAERIEEEVLDKYKSRRKQERDLQRWRQPNWNGEECEEVEKFRISKRGEDCWARIFSCFG